LPHSFIFLPKPIRGLWREVASCTGNDVLSVRQQRFLRHFVVSSHITKRKDEVRGPYGEGGVGGYLCKRSGCKRRGECRSGHSSRWGGVDKVVLHIHLYRPVGLNDDTVTFDPVTKANVGKGCTIGVNVLTASSSFAHDRMSPYL